MRKHAGNQVSGFDGSSFQTLTYTCWFKQSMHLFHMAPSQHWSIGYFVKHIKGQSGTQVNPPTSKNTDITLYALMSLHHKLTGELTRWQAAAGRYHRHLLSAKEIMHLNWRVAATVQTFPRRHVYTKALTPIDHFSLSRRRRSKSSWRSDRRIRETFFSNASKECAVLVKTRVCKTPVCVNEVEVEE